MSPTSINSRPWNVDLNYNALLVGGVVLWWSLVVLEVDGPYLDEFFHIRQSIVYYENRFSEWDPKITTPPGLYFLSYPWLHLLGLLRIPGSVEAKLRALNAVALVLLWNTTCNLIKSIKQGSSEKDTTAQRPPKDRDVARGDTTCAHIAMNIALLPTLFFFSGLYYTDVISALVVLNAHAAFYAQQPFRVFLWSLVSLTLRQTNIFWTGVYLAALEVRRTINTSDDSVKPADPDDDSAKQTSEGKSLADVIQRSWQSGKIYDLQLHLASAEDYLKTMLSLGIAAVSNLQLIILPLIPHISVLISFVAFVIFNGGVVLGDKSNHIASLHVPQMLYIWPYMIFFSFPIVLVSLSSKFQSGKLMVPLPDTVIALLGAAVFWVAMNTIVHPFILADNRHYTFYVFRILIRHPALRYVATPVYILCGWACIASFEGQASTVLIWCIVSILSLVTAPLVEPRYFILPWIMWRVHVHIPQSPVQPRKSIQKQSATVSQATSLVIQHSLWLETAWLVVVNVVVGYIFLRWKFEWSQEPGAVMRFMW